jgi:dTDP-glucose 4,6-dehydratase
MGVDIEIVSDEQRLRPDNSEVERLWAANGKARHLLAWNPKYGGLEGFRRGLAETVAWFRDPAHLRLYKPDVYNI